MIKESFEQSCDRLSCIVDSKQFQRLLWSRTEAPMLARLVELLHLALEDRPDFSLSEEGSTKSAKRHVLRIHGTRVIALTIRLHEGCAVLDGEVLERSKFLLKPGDPLCDEFGIVDEVWMAAALEVLFARVYPMRRETDASEAEAAAAAEPDRSHQEPRRASNRSGARPL
jgi:hypothetical protein